MPVGVVVEGQISDVVDYGDGNGTMTVMGIVIEIPEGVPIATPTAVLTMAQFADARSLPGRRQPGFVGAAAVVTGTSTKGRVTASDVFVTPARAMLIGPVTSKQPFQVNGVSVEVLDDARMPGEPLKKILGVPVVPGKVPIGATATVEGYFGNTGTLHAGRPFTPRWLRRVESSGLGSPGPRSCRVGGRIPPWSPRSV